MGFRNNAYATVWETRPNDNSIAVRLSTSRKSGTNPDGTTAFDTDFSAWVLFIKDAYAQAKKLKPKDRIQLLSTDCVLTWDSENQRENKRFFCYEFKEVESFNRSGKKASTPAKKAPVRETKIEFPDEDQDEEMPF